MYPVLLGCVRPEVLAADAGVDQLPLCTPQYARDLLDQEMLSLEQAEEDRCCRQAP